MGFVYLYLSSIGFISPPDEASTFPFSTPSRRSLSKETSPNPSNGPEDLCLKPQEKDRTQGVSFIIFFIWFGHLSEMLELSFWNMANWKMGSPHGEFKCASICVFFCVDIIEFWCPSKSQLIPTASFSPLDKKCVFDAFPQFKSLSFWLGSSDYPIVTEIVEKTHQILEKKMVQNLNHNRIPIKTRKYQETV